MMVLGFLALLLGPTTAQTRTSPGPGDDVRVCTLEEAGFCMLENGVTSAASVTSDTQLRGFHKELRAIVLAHRNYTVRVLGSYGELQVRTRAGECDIGWGEFFHTVARKSCDASCPALTAETAAGTVASWEPYRCCADYSINVLPLSIVALYRGAQRTFFEAFYNAVTDAFFINLLSFAFIWLVFFAHCVWLAERRGNGDEFPMSYLDGIDDAIWWAIVTFTTVGYGDKAPRSPAGRIVAMVWMILGITLSAILTGHLAGSFLSAGTANSAAREAMANQRVCGYPSTFDRWYVPSDISFTPVIGQSVADCGTKMAAGLADVILMEQPTLSYWKSHDLWARDQNLRMSSPLNAGNPTPMGVVFPYGSTCADRTSAHANHVHVSPCCLAVYTSQSIPRAH